MEMVIESASATCGNETPSVITGFGWLARTGIVLQVAVLLVGDACAQAPSAAAPESLANAWTPGVTFRDCPECPEMVVIPPGSFAMGSPWLESGRKSDEGPRHTVTIPHPIAVGKFEVTFAEYDACFAAKGCAERPNDRGRGRGARPVTGVNWTQAKVYVEWLSRNTGENYRLLSEAEWEYAARAGTTTSRFWGDDPHQGCGYANGADESARADHEALPGYQEHGMVGRELPLANCLDGHSFAAPVGSFKPNPVGLHDMLGNVSEWTEDCGNQNYEGAPTDGSPWLSGDCNRRVRRGGSFLDLPQSVRSASRDQRGAGLSTAFIGFRVARSN